MSSIETTYPMMSKRSANSSKMNHVGGRPVSPRLDALVTELERRYPGLDDNPDDSPWASWPLFDSIADGTGICLNIIWSQSERISHELRLLANERGLVVYEPAGERSHPPEGPGRSDTCGKAEALVEAGLTTPGAPERHPVRFLPGVFVDELNRVTDRLRWPGVVVTVPKHEPLAAARHRVEKDVGALGRKALVLGHVEHEDLCMPEP